MKHLRTALNCLAALALVSLGAGCASDLEGKQNLAAAAGFKLITPANPQQQSILDSLPDGKVTPVMYNGSQYYVLPDEENNQAYVGGPKQYQAYQQLRLAKQMSNDNLMAAQMNEMSSMRYGGGWGAWGGWGGWGPGTYW